jgi:hypothetical protein
MSMIGNYMRLTPLEVDRARKDLGWAREFADDLEDAELDAPESADGTLAVERLYRTEKAWDALRFLLERAGCPVNVVFGEEEFTEEDWGYGPAHILSAERVVAASAFLGSTGFDALMVGLTFADFDAAKVYPQMWNDAEALDWLRTVYEELVAYFAAAASVGDALIVWLS